MKGHPGIAILCVAACVQFALVARPCRAGFCNLPFDPTPRMFGFDITAGYDSITGSFSGQTSVIIDDEGDSGIAFFSPDSQFIFDVTVTSEGALGEGKNQVFLIGSIDVDGDSIADLSGLLLDIRVDALCFAPAGEEPWAGGLIGTLAGGLLTRSFTTSGGETYSSGFTGGRQVELLLATLLPAGGIPGDFSASFNVTGSTSELRMLPAPGTLVAFVAGLLSVFSRRRAFRAV